MDKLKSSQDELNNLAFAVENGQKFGAVKGNEDGVSVDLKDTIQILNTKTANSQLKDELKKINSNFEKMVIYSKTDGTRSGSYGISISPLNKLISIAKNIDISTSDGWLELSHEYTKNIINSRSIDIADNSIVATKTSFGAILEEIFILLGEEEKNLNEFSKWNGKWFYIVNLSNGTGIPLPLFEYDTIGDIKIYRSPIDLNDEAHVLDLIYDEKNKKVISYSFIQVWFDDGWQLRMDKEYKNINDGDKISITAPIIEPKTYKTLDSMWLGDINVEAEGIYIDKFSVDYFGDIATLGELIYSKDSKGNINIIEFKKVNE